MGQYYKAIIVNEDKKTIKSWAQSWDYGNGSKLMEHSWLQNDFVARMEVELLNNPQILLWGGDYADPETDKDGNVRKSTYLSGGLPCEYDITLYDMCKDKDGLVEGQVFNGLPINKCRSSKRRRYILNHDTKQFVDKKNLAFDSEGWTVHPLPLLVAEGNNRGGGDYRDNNPDFDKVGIWARNRISIETRRIDIPEDFTELIVKFSE